MKANKQLRQIITMATEKGLLKLEGSPEPLTKQDAERVLFSALAEVQRIFDVLRPHEKEMILRAIEELEELADNFGHLKEYRIHNGKTIAIIWRKKGADLTEPCPYCGKKHSHGIGDGLRVPHCLPSDKKFNPRITFSDGETGYWDDGYYLKSR